MEKNSSINRPSGSCQSMCLGLARGLEASEVAVDAVDDAGVAGRLRCASLLDGVVVEGAHVSQWGAISAAQAGGGGRVVESAAELKALRRVPVRRTGSRRAAVAGVRQCPLGATPGDPLIEGGQGCLVEGDGAFGAELPRGTLTQVP